MIEPARPRGLRTPLAVAAVLMEFVTGLSLVQAGTLPDPPDAVTTRSFDRMLSLDQEAGTSAGVSVGDIDGDGHLDVVLARGRHWPRPNVVMFGDGRGNFPRRAVVGGADRSYSGALADLDRDGTLDLVVSNDRPDAKRVYLNDGTGRFIESGTFGEAAWPTRYVSLADLNGDDFPDIIVANRNGTRSGPVAPCQICFNDRHGRFTDVRPLPGASCTTIVAADLDGDDAIDLFLPHRDGGPSRIAWNDTRGGFSETTACGDAESRTRAAAAADLNDDGLVDLLVGGPAGKGLVIHWNAGGRTFGNATLLSSVEHRVFAVAVADMNRDQRSDIVVGYEDGHGATLFGDRSGGYAETAWGDGHGAIYGVAVGDFNGDGWPDITTARSGAPDAVWFSEPDVPARD